MYLIKYEKQAVKDIKNLKGAKLDGKAKALIEILKRNPLEPPCESLVGNLSGLYSRRINIQHRLVYEIINEEVTIYEAKYSTLSSTRGDKSRMSPIRDGIPLKYQI